MRLCSIALIFHSARRKNARGPKYHPQFRTNASVSKPESIQRTGIEAKTRNRPWFREWEGPEIGLPILGGIARSA